MAPSQQPPAAGASSPTADDLLFLLSIVRNPNSFIAEDEKHQQQKSTKDTWRQSLLSLPAKRRHIILSIQRLDNALQKWRVSSTKHNVNQTSKVDTFSKHQLDYIDTNNEAYALLIQEVEDAASAIRTYIAEYQTAIYPYKVSLKQHWVLPHHNNSYDNDTTTSQLEYVGYQLTTQLLHQLSWDERLMQTILQYVNEEMYSSPENDETNKLRVWSKSMSIMLCIDTPYWQFVEREVYDETVLERRLDNDEEEDEDADGRGPNLLNGEHSTQFTSIDLVLNEVEEVEVQTMADVPSSSTTTSEDVSLHEQIASSASVEEAIQSFMHCNSHETTKHYHTNEDTDQLLHTRRCPMLTSILVMGEEGSGKTHLLDSIQQNNASPNESKYEAMILRPTYLDIFGASMIGSTEDRIIALFTYALRLVSSSSGRRCLILLDDIDRMLSITNNVNTESSSDADINTGTTQQYIGRRCKALFLTILDALRERLTSSSVKEANGHILLLCTSRSNCDEIVGRFDRTYRIGLPDDMHRRQIITSCLTPIVDVIEEDGEGEDQTLLSVVIHHSSGKSAFELAQCCREAILSSANTSTGPNQDDVRDASIFKCRLQCLDKILQTKSPPSIRGGTLDGIVDMRVSTPEELQSKLTIDVDGEVRMPLLGVEANRAFEALMNVVITPLCRSDDIQTLLYGGGEDGTILDNKPTVRVGALLAGAPGVGKSSLAYHCACLAAKMSPRITLLDVSCTSLIHKEIGGSERAVQHLFAAVRAAAPCILLLDGIESVAPKRGNDNTTEGTMDRVLSTFLTEMDGIDTGSGNGPSGNVAVIGITQREDLIDPSLLRPGRLDKTIILGVPDFEARKELVARQIQDVDFDFSLAGYFDVKSKENVSHSVAMESVGMSAVEVIAICKEASMACLRELNFEAKSKPLLKYEHFQQAIVTMKGKSLR